MKSLQFSNAISNEMMKMELQKVIEEKKNERSKAIEEMKAKVIAQDEANKKAVNYMSNAVLFQLNSIQ